MAGKVLSIASDTHVLEAKGRAEKEAETRKLEEAKKEAEKARAEAERKEAEETKKQQQEVKRQEAAKKKEAEKALAALAEEAANRKADKDKQTEALRVSLGFRNHFSFVKVISEGLRCRRVSCVCVCACVCVYVCVWVGVWVCRCVAVWVCGCLGAVRVRPAFHLHHAATAFTLSLLAPREKPHAKRLLHVSK